MYKHLYVISYSSTLGLGNDRLRCYFELGMVVQPPLSSLYGTIVIFTLNMAALGKCVFVAKPEPRWCGQEKS